MDRRQTLAGRKARIQSELIPVGSRCISFYYYMNYTIGANLNVYLNDPRLNISTLLWTTDENHGDFWILKEITVLANMTADDTNRFTIVYEAVVGTRTGGKILKKTKNQRENVLNFSL